MGIVPMKGRHELSIMIMMPSGLIQNGQHDLSSGWDGTFAKNDRHATAWKTALTGPLILLCYKAISKTATYLERLDYISKTRCFWLIT